MFLEGAGFWACVRVERGCVDWVEVTADRLVRRRSPGTACFGVLRDHMRSVGPVRRAWRCALEGIPSAAVVFVQVTTEPRIPGQDVWPVVPDNMWRPEQVAAMCEALRGHAAALPRVPAAKASSNRPAASLVILRGGSQAWCWVIVAGSSWRWSRTPPRCVCMAAEGCRSPRFARPTWRPCTWVLWVVMAAPRCTSMYLQGTVVGTAAPRYRRSYGGDALRLVMAEGMAPWLRAFTGSRWTIAGDPEKFADAWRRWVEGQFPAEGMMHLPPPPNVPPVWLAAPVVAVAKAVPKAVPKPAPKKGVGVSYGNYSNIRAVFAHLGGCLAAGQHGAGNVNVCPWSKLEGAGQCQWRAGRHPRPSHLNPRDLIDHLAKDHGSNPAEREQAEAMVTGVMPCVRTVPFAVAKARPVTLALPSGAQPPGAQAASSSSALSGTKRSAAVPSMGGKGGGPGAGALWLRSGDRGVEVPSEEQDPASPDPVQATSASSRAASSAGTSSRGTRRGSASGRGAGVASAARCPRHPPPPPSWRTGPSR